ncbi:MAG: 3-oxoacyl-ACP reductase FabG [Planctomycetota bacterium]
MPASSLPVSLVTGASRGIGRAIALRLASRGDRVIVHYAGGAREARAVVGEILARGGAAESAAADLRDPAAVEALFQEIRKTHGRLDALVNNAAVARDRPLTRMSEEDWSAVLETNLTGAFRMAKGAVRLLRKSPNASIVLVGSSGALRGTPGQANYAASKAGCLGLMRSLMRELGSWGIRVNAVLPGFTRATGMTKNLSDGAWRKILEETPLGRLCLPEDVAHAVAFLTSVESACVTGQTLLIDGGRA